MMLNSRLLFNFCNSNIVFNSFRCLFKRVELSSKWNRRKKKVKTKCTLSSSIKQVEHLERSRFVEELLLTTTRFQQVVIRGIINLRKLFSAESGWYPSLKLLFCSLVQLYRSCSEICRSYASCMSVLLRSFTFFVIIILSFYYQLQMSFLVFVIEAFASSKFKI